MRPASSYRAAKRNAPKAAGAPPADEAERAAARKKLAQWAANGGRDSVLSPAITQQELDAINAKVPMPVEAAVEAAQKITSEDVDAALEKALTNWQHEIHRIDPLPLSRLFAARARALGWVEGVEFVEEK